MAKRKKNVERIGFKYYKIKKIETEKQFKFLLKKWKKDTTIRWVWGKSHVLPFWIITGEKVTRLPKNAKRANVKIVRNYKSRTGKVSILGRPMRELVRRSKIPRTFYVHVGIPVFLLDKRNGYISREAKDELDSKATRKYLHTFRVEMPYPDKEKWFLYSEDENVEFVYARVVDTGIDLYEVVDLTDPSDPGVRKPWEMNYLSINYDYLNDKDYVKNALDEFKYILGGTPQRFDQWIRIDYLDRALYLFELPKYKKFGGHYETRTRAMDAGMEAVES
jgi:hypothetical protein